MSWRINPTENKTGLLVIDAQERLLPAIDGGERIAAKIAVATALARLFSIPLIATEQVPEKLGPTVPGIDLGGVTPLHKTTFSAVPAILSDTLPKTLLVCGVETHICVRQTVYDLRSGGRTVILLGDAVGSRSPLDHTLALEEMRSDKVLVTSVEALGWELAGGANSPHFKAVFKLLK